MAFNKGNLVPTSVMRSDGHMTTVHKKSATASSSGVSRLAAAKPSIGKTVAPPVHPNDKKMLKIAWSGRKDGAGAVSTGPHSILDKLGLSIETTESGAERLSHGDIYEYLKMGIRLPEASYLQSVMPVEEWKTVSRFQESIPGDLAYVTVWGKNRKASIDDAVDFLRANGIAPRIAQKMLLNGFSDHHTRGVLNAEQLERLFIRFKYQSSVDENKDTNAAVAIDAIVDGRLPFEAFTHDFKRTLLTDTVDAIYPRKAPSGQPTELTEADREYLKSNPQQIVPAMTAAWASDADFSTTYTAIREFGADAIKQHHPELLLERRADGSYFGVEGAQRAVDFREFVDTILKDGEKTSQHREKTNLVITESYRDKSVIPFKDILAIQDEGASNEWIADLLFERGLTAEQAKAVIRGDTGSALADGWL